MSHKIKLIALDMDGTLYNDKLEITEANQKLIKAALADGVHVIISTGRPYCGLPLDTFRALGIRYAITSNGGGIYDIADNKCIFSRCMTPEVVAPIIRYLQDKDIQYDAFIDGNRYRETSKQPIIDRLTQFPAATRAFVKSNAIFVSDLAAYIEERQLQVQKMTINFYPLPDGTYKDRDDVWNYLTNNPQVTALCGGYKNIEYTLTGTTKAMGLRFLADFLQVPMDATMACGDTQNDADIMQAAAIGVAMGNADNDIKAIADFVSKTNNDSGVAYAIEKFVFGTEYVTLGKTGLKVSRLGFGGIPIQKVDAATTKELIKAMEEKGINYIDTARGYTVSESFLGEALEGYRDKFILATKSMAVTKEAMAADIETSLKNLRTDYIDLYQIHNPSADNLAKIIAPGGALEALFEAKEAGKIGHIGFTTHTTQLFEKALAFGWVETIMFPYNLVETQGEDLMRQCTEKNIGFIVMKPLAGGAIEDPNLALRFICANPDVSIVIPGMYDVKEIDMNLAAASDNAPLSAKEWEKIEKIRNELGSNFCRRCNYCQPCSAGIGISAIFILQGYYDRYGLQDWAKARYDATPVKASACIDCGACEPRCPYNLPIRAMLKDCVEKFEK